MSKARDHQEMEERRLKAARHFDRGLGAAEVARRMGVRLSCSWFLASWVSDCPWSRKLEHLRLPQRDLFWSFKNLFAVRAGDAKLVRTNALGKNPDAKPKTELFDLSKDRAESLDLSAGSTAQVEDFARRLDRWQKDVESGPKTEATRTLAR